MTPARRKPGSCVGAGHDVLSSGLRAAASRRTSLGRLADHAQALSFGAAEYDRFRPRNPEEAPRWALDGLPAPP